MTAEFRGRVDVDVDVDVEVDPSLLDCDEMDDGRWANGRTVRTVNGTGMPCPGSRWLGRQGWLSRLKRKSGSRVWARASQGRVKKGKGRGMKRVWRRRGDAETQKRRNAIDNC